MNQHTDADVARMLGWTIENGWYRGVPQTPCNGIPIFNIPFGLSTTPSPEADANAARYVIPWMRKQGIDWWCESVSGQIEVSLAKMHIFDLIRFEGDHFGPTLCRACLESVTKCNRLKETEDATDAAT